MRADPESQISAADRAANFALLKELQALNGRLTAAVKAARQVNVQLGAIKKELGDSAKVPAPFRAVLPFKLGGLAGNLSGFLAAASVQDLRTLGEVRTGVPVAIDETNAIVARFTAFVKQLSEAGLYPPMPKPVK